MNSDDENLDRYLSELRGLPVLFVADEPALLSAGRAGDEAAKKRLVEGYLELAALLALRLAPVWMRPLDVIQEANVVLIRLLDDESVAAPARELSPSLVRHYQGIKPR